MLKIQKAALNNEVNLQKDPWFKKDSSALKVTSLNIAHLPSRLSDLQNDPTILMSDIICLQETFSASMPLPRIDGFECLMPPSINQGRGRGVAAFIKKSLMQNFLGAEPVNEPIAQCLKLSFKHYNVITVYKTQECTTLDDHRQVIQILKELVNPKKPMPTVINGDFNFDYWREKDNLLRVTLEKAGFKQLVKLPTTIRGKCIDHVYINDKMKGDCTLYYPYYTDHEAARVILRKNH